MHPKLVCIEHQTSSRSVLLWTRWDLARFHAALPIGASTLHAVSVRRLVGWWSVGRRDGG